VVEREPRGLACGRHDEGLNIEAADEPAMADAMTISLDIALYQDRPNAIRADTGGQEQPAVTTERKSAGKWHYPGREDILAGRAKPD